jgi:hypothetical protein
LLLLDFKLTLNILYLLSEVVNKLFDGLWLFRFFLLLGTVLGSCVRSLRLTIFVLLAVIRHSSFKF